MQRRFAPPSRLPKAACVERLAALQPRLQILKVVCELLIFAELHHVVEMLHVLHHCVELPEEGKEAEWEEEEEKWEEDNWG